MTDRMTLHRQATKVRASEDVVARVVEAIGKCMVGSSLEDQAIAALEASHHAELVEVLTRCRRFFVSKWSADEAEACLAELDTLLTKLGGAE